ncbi:hypothetical protein [Marinitoga sp. 38H-ov]|uniref:hypothetical protein n=1 Tax=Marinitoga sp. 38H-ov TaxID=1755814 RepID=UPI0013ED0BFF|nr:hypothetical protein [Marinitoga sp. 38H-ov]KAF2955046.1 hypothetical protein AS160_02465 [Marinitoga sp. 38H-ov]
MYKKISLILFLISTLFIFGNLVITSESTKLFVGEETEILISTNQSTLTHLNVEISSGGFDDPLILFDGIDLINGKAQIKYLSPWRAGESIIKFYNEELNIEKTIKINIVEKILDTQKTTLIILEKKGNVLYKEPNSDIWDSLKDDTIIQEESELLTLKDGFIHLKEPTLNIEIKVSSETQLFLKKLRASENGDIDIEYELKKGATVNKIKEILAPGSKYLVGSGSVVAGVRGTEFGFEKKGDVAKIRTFEGTVYTMVNNKLFPVTVGNMFNYSTTQKSPQIQRLDKPLEQYEKEITPEIPKEPETVENKLKKEEAQNSIEESVVKSKANIGNISFGKQIKGTNSYLVYSFAPSLDIGPVGLGIGFNAYQEDIDSPLYYGLPSKEASRSDNLLSAISINYLKFDFPMFYIRYGISPSYTKGLGLFMNNYYIPYSRVLDTEIRLNNLKIGVHIPYEILSFVPFEFSKSSDILFGYIDADLGIFNAEFTAILNTDSNSNDINQAYLTTLYKDILFFKVGVETDVVLTKDGTMVYGLLAGPTIKFPPYFQFMFGINYISDGFNIEYLNAYYEYNIANNYYLDLGTESSFGLIGKSIFTISPYLNMIINYNKLFSENRDSILNGEIMLNIPSLGGMPQLTAGFSYTQYKFLEDYTVDNIFLNDNANLQGFIYYPVLENSGIIYSISYNMRDKKFEYTLNFETKEF